jgi:alpha-L-fucosidase 2
MNYWLAETTNLSELTEPLFAMLDSGKPVYTEHTHRKYGDDTPGFITRMSINPYGGTGWDWNIEGTAWLAQHYWTRYRYGQDLTFLKGSAYPFLREVSRFWMTQLKTLPDGRLVVPNAWSHEHGPHEDGTAHAQELMWDLFSNTIDASKELNVDEKLRAELTEIRDRLAGPQVGSWGQLMEWMEEKPELEKSHHRHTSHLYALHPGRQITMEHTPELSEGARVSLTQRGETGDSRREWAWAWRTALWARLYDAQNAHDCIAGLLAYNTLPNLWGTHPPFQTDGNFGISNGFAEMFVQHHTDILHVFPALPDCWKSGHVNGLSARKNIVVDLSWKDGQADTIKLLSPVTQTVKLKIMNQEPVKEIKLEAGKVYRLKC